MQEHNIRIPLRLIEKQYGRDNVDKAGDELADLLVEISDHLEQYRYAFDFDTEHVNPHFHALIFTVFDTPDFINAQLIDGIRALGVIE